MQRSIAVEGEPIGAASSPESIMSAGVVVLVPCYITAASLASVNGMGGEGLCNCLVVAERTWKGGTNENGGMFVHVYSVFLQEAHTQHAAFRFWSFFSGDSVLSSTNIFFLLRL